MACYTVPICDFIFWKWYRAKIATKSAVLRGSGVLQLAQVIKIFLEGFL